MKNPTYYAAYLAEHPAYTVMPQSVFLARATNAFDLNLPLIVTDATPACLPKLTALYGALDALNVAGVPTPVEAFAEGEIYMDGVPFCARKRYTYGDLVEVIRRLRDPDGCPWDRAQTHQSIRANLLEECYEMLEGIDDGSAAEMREEGGDVLLQSLLHAVIAEQAGEFTPEDMVSDLAQKLVSRHTHVFGPNRARDARDALQFWDAAKSEEKKTRSTDDKLARVPKTFPPVMRAQKVLKIVAKTGFTFPDVDAALQQLQQEVEEFRAAATEEQREAEGGDVLFAAVNALRLAGVDGSVALNGSVDRFLRRFARVERLAEEQGETLEGMSVPRMRALLQRAKAQEGQGEA